MNSSTRFLTGLRGYSALAVFLIHSGGGGIRSLGEWGNKLVDFGKYGVVSFFVLSALTLSMSIDRSSRFSYAHYLSRRFARIFPMYCIAILILWLAGGADYYLQIFRIQPYDIQDLFAHLTFLNLWDVKYQNTVIGVEWTVPVEMWTYLLIPPLFFSIRRNNYMWGWIIFIVAIAISMQNQLWHKGTLATHWAIETYFYCFIIGILAYKYFTKIGVSENIADIGSIGVLILIGVLAINADYLTKHWLAFLFSISPNLVYFSGSSLTELLFSILVAALILILSKARLARIIFENRPIVFLGNVSFPFYLFHLPVLTYLVPHTFIDWQKFLFGLIISLGISYCCHIYIERPTLKLSGKLHPYDS